MRMVREARCRQAEAPDTNAANAERGICQGEELGRALFQAATVPPRSRDGMRGGKAERGSGGRNPKTS